MYSKTAKGVVVLIAITIAVILSSIAYAIPNPAALYCSNMGWEFSTVKVDDSSEYGVCRFSDAECDAWEFYSGKCGKQHSVCAQNGYETVTKNDGRDPYSREYALCVPVTDSVTGMAVARHENGQSTLSTILRRFASYIFAGGTITGASVSELSSDGISAYELSGLNATIASYNRNASGLNDIKVKSIKEIIDIPPGSKEESGESEITKDGLPSTFDWRTYNGYNWMTPVKNQGGCGSCWAFSATGTLEAGLKIARNDPTFDLDLSEQELVSCADDDGCGGGDHAGALTSYVDTQGLSDEWCMPYTGTNGVCSGCTAWGPRSWHIDDAHAHYDVSVADAKSYLINNGPLGANFYMYGGFDGSGVYRCDEGGWSYFWNHWDHGHAIVIVGYNDAGGYWLIKNSWGSTWNGDGYFKMGYGECELLDGQWPDSSRGIVYIDKTWPTVSKVANLTSTNVYRGTLSGSLANTKTRDGTYITMQDTCSGGNCNGIDVRANIAQSTLQNPSYMEVYARQRARDALDFQWQALLPPGTWVKFGNIAYTPNSWGIQKYTLCNSKSSCASYFANNQFQADFDHAACTGCDVDYLDVDWFAVESDTDTDNDGVLDSVDMCPTQYGTFCRGCPSPSCGSCSYNPTCPGSGMPYCASYYGTGTLCNSYGACSSASGDNRFNTGGEYWCYGYCDGANHCDYADSCTYSASCDTDDDNDGVIDTSDLCLGTPTGQSVDANGCSAAQVDQDLDGLCNPGKTSTWCTGSDSCQSSYGPSCNYGCPDTAPPELNITRPVNGTSYDDPNVSVVLTASDFCLDTVWFGDSAQNITLQSPYSTYHVFSGGQNIMRAYANDTSGNIAGMNVTFFTAINHTGLNCSFGSVSHACSSYNSVESIDVFMVNSTSVEAGSDIEVMVNWTGWHWDDSNYWAFFINSTFVSACSTYAADQNSHNHYTMNCTITVPYNIPAGYNVLGVTANDYQGYCEPNETGVDNESSIGLSVTNSIGRLQLVSFSPNVSMNVSHSANITFNMSVVCVQGNCSDVVLILDPEKKASVSSISSDQKFNVLSSGYDSIRLKFSGADLGFSRVKTKEGVFGLLSAGEYGFTTDIGMPQLPVVRELVEIPYSGRYSLAVLDFAEEEKSLAEIGIDEKIIPVQEPVEKLAGAKENARFRIDSAAYSKDSWTIGKVASVASDMKSRGRRYLLLEVYPVDYNPADKTIKVRRDISIEISFSGVDKSAVQSKKTRFGAAEDIATIASYDPDKSSAASKGPPGYLIISAPQFISYLDGFVSWKTGQGFDVTLVSTAATGSSAAQIKNYIQNMYDTCSNSLDFVLLVGDTDTIPNWTGNAPDTPPTDLYYSTLEGTDYFPDVKLGRFPATSASELENMISKTIKNTRIKQASFMASSDNYVISEGSHDYVISQYLDPDVWSSERLYYYRGATTVQVSSAIDNGRDLAVYSGHGGSTSWSDGPPFSQADVQALVNTGIYPFILSFACLTGNYPVAESFAETWLRDEHGASSFMGSSVTSYWNEDDVMERAMFAGWFDLGMNTTAAVMNHGKVGLWNFYGDSQTVRRYFEMYNLFGDPSYDISPVTKGIIPMNSGSPFYTMNQNPVSCGDMEPGQSCSASWNVTATGAGETTWAFYGIYNDSYSSNTTSKTIVTIRSDWDRDGSNSSVDCDDNNSSIMTPVNGMRVTSDRTFCPGTYYLDEGIAIGDDVTLDCNGAVIIGSSNLNGSGIRLVSINNSLVRGCAVMGYAHGFLVNSTGYSNITNSSSLNNSRGFTVISSSHNRIYDNTVQGNAQGFYVSGSSDNDIWLNRVHDTPNTWDVIYNEYCINNESNTYHGFFGPSCPVNITGFQPPASVELPEPMNASFNITFSDANQPSSIRVWWFVNNSVKLSANVTPGSAGSGLVLNESGHSLSFWQNYSYASCNFSGSYSAASHYSVKVVVGDGFHNASQEWNLKVNNTNRPPVWSHQMMNFTFNEDSSVEYDLNATDEDNETISYHVNDSRVNISASSGMIGFLPPADWFGALHALVTAGDGFDNTTELIVFNVTPVNDAPVLNASSVSVTVNESELVNASRHVSASDVDNATLLYYYSVPLNSSGLWLTTTNDSGSYNASVIVSDGMANASALLDITVLDAPDWDGDGIPDYIDPDDDNDGIPDTEDNLLGNGTSVGGNLNLTIYLNGSLNIIRPVMIPLNLTFLHNNSPVVEILFNFTEAILNLRNVSIIRQNTTAPIGSLIVRGLHLLSQLKTIYIDRVDPSISTICIKDADVSSLDEISSTCSGSDEHYISCPGTLLGYRCNITGSRFVVSGLRFSAVQQMYVPPAPSGSRGGGGGGSATTDINIYPTVDGHQAAFSGHSTATIFHLGSLFSFRLTTVGFLDVSFTIDDYEYSLTTISNSVNIDTDRDGSHDLTVILAGVKSGKATLIFRLYGEQPKASFDLLPANYSRPRRQDAAPAAEETISEDSAQPAASQTTEPPQQEASPEEAPVQELPSESGIISIVRRFRNLISGVIAFIIILFAGLFMVYRSRKHVIIEDSAGKSEDPDTPVRPKQVKAVEPKSAGHVKKAAVGKKQSLPNSDAHIRINSDIERLKKDIERLK